MAVKREVVGDPYMYRGRLVSARYMGPDLLAFVNDVELPHFYDGLEAVRSAGRRWIDAEEKDRKEARAKRQPVR